MPSKIWMSLLAVVGLATSISVAEAELPTPPKDFPRRPINLVVVYPAGGGMDVTARALAKVAEEVLKHEFRVENRVGGAGMVGHTYLAKNAQADGYTIGVVANPFLFTDILLRDAPFGKDDFDPLVFINFEPAIWMANAKGALGASSFDDIVTNAKQNPGKLRAGVLPNNVFQFVTEFVERTKGVKFTHVPFQGGQPGVVALLAGDIDVTMAFFTEAEQHIGSGDLKAIAVADDKRFPRLPDTPTFSEVGVPVAENTWGAARFLVLPKGVPQERRDYLEAAFLEVLKSEVAKKAFADIGLELSPANTQKTAEIYSTAYDSLRTFLTETGRISGK